MAEAAAKALIEIDPLMLLSERTPAAETALAEFSLRTGCLVFSEQILDPRSQRLSSRPPREETKADAEEMRDYKLEDQPWFNVPIPSARAVDEQELLSFADEIDIVMMTATEVERDAVLRRLEPYPRKRCPARTLWP